MDNEEVYVDGIDISECEYACNTAFGKNGCKHPMMKNIYCSKNPNCYFKQLARKTREFEQKEKELKELKRQYKLSCLDCEYKNTKRDADRYRKALEEIERYINNQGIDNKWNMRIQRFRSGILDIINKAKGEGKCQ